MGCYENQNDRDIHYGSVIKTDNKTMEFLLLKVISYAC